MKSPGTFALTFLLAGGLAAFAAAGDGEATVLFDGSGFSQWNLAQEGGWVILEDGSMTCLMKEEKGKDGKPKQKSMGDIWSKAEYADFDLTLSYKLSEGANSGVFYRSDPASPVQNGLEVQLMDNEGFQKTHGVKDARKLNGSFYDGKAPSSDPANPPGEWNTLRLICEGPRIRIAINGEQVIDVNIDEWDTPGMNPDGTKNKFKAALKDFPRKGRIGFQNHGQQVWFKDVKITPLSL